VDFSGGFLAQQGFGHQCFASCGAAHWQDNEILLLAFDFFVEHGAVEFNVSGAE